MVTLAQATAGIERYLDTEILAKIPGWQKWVLGAAASRMLSRSGEIFNTLKSNPVVSAMGIIDEQDQIDIDAVYQEFAAQAQRGAVTFDVPFVGALTLTTADVDKLYRYIIGG
nr:MAG TPA: hypothetical protein [Caudoviricetes sp.]